MPKMMLVGCIAMLIVVFGGGGWGLFAQGRPPVTAALVDQWMTELSNWGRWGANDQLGAVILTPAKRREALSLATTGDVILLRTGRWVNGNRSGYDVSVAPWLKEHAVALGANIFDNLDLEAVAETATRLNRWEFLLVAAPIPSPGGIGSPLNPLAIF